MLCVKSGKTGVKSEKTGIMKWKTRIKFRLGEYNVGRRVKLIEKALIS